ncbi:MAG TPA: CRISPR-associated endonuclease Cas2 [Dictyoglomaceae bacterium]|nr:CRISPR-associated endonuclease Cas2 [Dictyoglomaceae bacterium]HOL39974.1 CRISPR-associated endonuclease Cas2 [Dictyoglomaceae bacterium]HOP95611.1 CRISPR-associated endonuclease Cas2 [Dictyoglomaceae bacterium]HPP16442.1 CRISPR-associated endonuclease Cas2 [Dictyoglomaceae bacterium]HPU43432.1 CRISPR-associated endonuclease Cas2 [Dictyoglomaceae bacterium]
MFVIVTYDISEERVNKVRKILKRYFTWVQNSVFEGEITIGKLEKCRKELQLTIVDEEDSIYFYIVENKNNYTKAVLGIEKDMDSYIY